MLMVSIIQVKQMHLIVPLDKQFSILYGLLKDHISENVDYKVSANCCCHFYTVVNIILFMFMMFGEINAGDCVLYNSKSNKPHC
jgi:hypothetical protein